MKHLIKSFFLATAITVSIGACSGNGRGGSADSSKVDTITSVSTTADTLIKTDSTKRDTSTMVSDTSKQNTDTLTKTVTTKKVVKKTVVKNP